MTDIARSHAQHVIAPTGRDDHNAFTLADRHAVAHLQQPAAPQASSTVAPRAEIGAAVPKPQVGTLGGALVLVLLLAVGVLWLLRRVSGGNLRRRYLGWLRAAGIRRPQCRGKHHLSSACERARPG